MNSDRFLENCMLDTVNDRRDVAEDAVCAEAKGEEELTEVTDNEDVGAEEEVKKMIRDVCLRSLTWWKFLRVGRVGL